MYRRGIDLVVTNGKLLRVVKELVYDIAVDLRKDSEIFGQWFGIVLLKKIKRYFMCQKDLYMNF